MVDNNTVQDEIKDLEEQHEANCMTLLSQNNQKTWIASHLKVLLDFAESPLEARIKISDRKRFTIEITQ